MARGAGVRIRPAPRDGVCGCPVRTRFAALRVPSRASLLQRRSRDGAALRDCDRVPARRAAISQQALVSPADRDPGLDPDRGDRLLLVRASDDRLVAARAGQAPPLRHRAAKLGPVVPFSWWACRSILIAAIGFFTRGKSGSRRAVGAGPAPP